MTLKDAAPILEAAIKTFGKEPQKLKAIEEMSELTKELCKGNDSTHIAEETADTLIMLEQVIMMYGIRDKVEDFISWKLQRLDERIKDRRSGVHIKSRDLCDRCKINMACGEYHDCYPECPCKIGQICYCVNVKIGTPCDLFQEVEENNT